LEYKSHYSKTEIFRRPATNKK
jgi:hypothetical protein